MKNILLIATLSLFVFTVGMAQGKKSLSPPINQSAQIATTTIELNYNAPSKRGRTIWGDLVPYGRVWRTGANNATKVKLDKDLKFNDILLPAGTYGLFSIPDEKVWTIIFNAESNQWGAFNYDSSKDVARIEVIPESVEDLQETLSISIENDQMLLKWDHLKISMSISE